jgi:class 3 adenylate cyclase/tetratricopeptide (TPR) repeat protein
VIVCPNCSHENESGAKFCSQCATPLAGARPSGGTERKIVTVLFADLVGFTSKAERLDPEDVQAVLAPYHQRLRYELERWGGTVEKFIGDAVVALFGAPVARENDPERAIRAALAIRDWIAEEGKLQVRIAVNTGEALVNLAARPEAGEGMAAGDVLNTTARLQSAAPTDGILAGETTYRATADTIEYREHAPVDAKGKEEPVVVWEVVGARARFGVDLTPEARTQLVGRDRELEQLVATLARARQQRSPELVTLIGVPGIGKSRLVGELFQSIERGGELTYWRQGRSLPYGEGVSYWALAEMVKAQAGILETDTDDDVEAKLARAVEQLIEEDAEWVLSHLRPLVGKAGDATGSQEEAFVAWRRFFEALGEEHAVVLVFEDIQWADEGLLDFVEHLVDWVRDIPMLILCTARLDLLERRPAWGGGKLNAANVAVAPLSDEETAKLISALSERPLLEAETQTALLDRAGGNPLYAEQYVRMLAERKPGEALALPETVQGIIAARLDALAADEKALLQDAAVVGKVFWLGALGATEQQLHALQQKEFVQRARRSSVESETEYAFKHLLVRDVAYGQVPRAERAQKHQRTAEWIESLGRPEDHAEMVAHHYLSALELGRAAGQDVSTITARVRAALREAGDRALALNALPQAENYFREALMLAHPGDADHPDLLFRLGRALYLRHEEGEDELAEARDALLARRDREAAAEAVLMLADIAWRQGRSDDTVTYLEDSRALVADAPPSRIQVSVLSQVARYQMLADENEAAIETGTEALKLAVELGFDDLRAHALNTVGSARSALGDRTGLAEIEESIAVAARANAISDVLRGHNNLSTMHIVLGELDLAEAGAQETRRLAEHFGHYGFARFIDGGAGVGIPYQMGRWDDALENAERFLASVEQGSPHYQAPAAYCFRGLIRLGRGDPETAVADAERALEFVEPFRDPQIVQPTLGMTAHIFHSVGEERRAAELATDAIERLRGMSQLAFAGVELHYLTWVASAFGRASEVAEFAERDPVDSGWLRAVRALAAGDLREAAEIYDEMGAFSAAAFYHLRAAEQLVAEGRRAEADEQLRPALAFYRGVGATRYLREGEALLAASA